MEGQINSYEGMNKDVGYDVIPNNLYIDAKDIRITTVSGESQGSFTNMKGTTEYFTIPTEGEYLGAPWVATNPKIIGYTTIRNRIIVFVADDSNNQGWIYDIQYDPATRTILPGFPNLILYGANLNFSSQHPIEAIGRFESQSIQKVYWTDYNNQLRSYNIELATSGNSTEIIEFHPKVVFYTPMLQGIYNGGQLQVGTYQITYRYRTIDGKETLIAPPSELIHITTSSEGVSGTSKYLGDISTVISNKAIKVKINTSSNNLIYNEIDIFLIYHNQAIGNPSVRYIETQTLNSGINSNEFLITGTEEGIYEIDYADYITRTYPFYTVKTLTQKDNDLVIANLKTKSFSASDRIAELGESFNFKLLRYDSTGTACLDEFNQEYNIDAHWLQDWLDNKQFKYLPNGSTLGAQAPNPAAASLYNIKVQFQLERTLIDSNDGASEGQNSIADTGSWSNFQTYNLLDGYSTRANTTFNNLASPFLSGVIRGYKRGETYRFGIIFYNKQGECSFVEHIGDIKFPDISDETDVDNGTPINPDNGYNYLIATTDFIGGDPNLIIGYNLGLKFNFDFSTCPQFYNEIAGYQIVRLERTFEDARRPTSGVVKTFSNFPSGAPFSDINFDLRLPSIGTPIYHLDADYDNTVTKKFMLTNFTGLSNPTGQLQTNVPKYGDILAFHSPEISYQYKNLETNIVNTANACLLVTGAYQYSISKITEVKKTFVSDYGIATDTYDNRLKINATYRVDRSTENIKIWQGKQFVKMDDSEDLLYTSVAGPFSAAGVYNFYLRNYHLSINTTTQAHFNDPEAPGSANTNRHEFNKGGTGLLGNMGKLLIDPITSATIPATSATEYWDNTLVKSPDQTIDGSTPIVDIMLPKEEIYGGFTQSSLENNLFKICSPFIEKNNLSPKVFGGDTFISMATFQSMAVDFNKDIFEKSTTPPGYSWAYGTSRSSTLVYPTESWFNIELDYGASLKRNGVGYFRTGGTYSSTEYVWRQETNNTFIGNAKSPNMYKQNDVFSIINQDIAFVTKPSNFNLSEVNDVRSRLSNTKSNGELTDSWTKFETTRFYDVDDYGPINKLINWRDIVYFFQDKGVGMHAINRTAVSSAADGTPLQLGTSLGFSKHQYLTKEHGSIHQWAIKATDQGIYYIDALSRKIFKIGEGNTAITELLGMHSWMQTLPANVFTLKQNGGDNPILNSGIIIARDKINDEIVFTFLSPETKYSLVFDELAQKFSSLYTPTPNIWIENNDILLSSLNGKVHLHNSGNYGEFYGTVTEAKLSLIVNPKSDYNKVLRFLEFNSIVRDNNKVIDRTKTITAFRIQTQYQDTGKVLFSPDRFKRKFDKWRLKIPRNQSSSSQHDRLRSTYFIVTLYFDNTYNKELIMNHLLSYYDIQVF